MDMDVMLPDGALAYIACMGVCGLLLGMAQATVRLHAKRVRREEKELLKWQIDLERKSHEMRGCK